MTDSEQTRLSRLFEHAPTGLSAAAVLVGILVLFGWSFDVAPLKSPFSGVVAMKANTALGFILAGVSLWTAGAQLRLFRIVSRFCGGGVLLLGLLVVAEYLSGADFGIDQLLARDITSLPGDIPGRMAVMTAACFAALGAALVLLSREKGDFILAVHALAMVPILVAGAALVSYGYDIEAFLRVKLNYTPMAIHTAAVFVLLGLGVVSARPDYPFRRILTSDSAAGGTARRLLPAAFALQLVMGWLLLRGLQAGYLSEAVGLALFAVANMAGLGALIQWNAVRLYLADAQRRLAEEALHTSAEEIEDLYNRAPIGYHSVDKDGTLVRINDTELAWLGYTREEVVGRMNFADLLTPESLKAFRDTFAESKARGWVRDLEYELIRKDGTILPVLLSATAVKDAQGNFVMSRSTIYDVTELKKLEAKLKQVSAYTRSLIEASLDPLVTISAAGKIMDVNQATERVTGFPRERLIGTEFSGYFTEPEKALEGYRQVLAEGFVKDYPLAIRHLSGEVTDVLYHATVFKNEAGEVLGVFAAARDVTERKQVEKQVKERMKELQAFYHLSAMAERKDFALESLCQELAKVLPESWQYPEIACARIVVGESEFSTANFWVSEWMQAAPIKVLGSVIGKIEIGYLKRKPEEDEGPFLKQERQLIDAIAERLGQITELKHAEAELRASEELFRALADATSEGMLIHEHGRIVEANRQMEAILGRPRAEIVGAAILDFVTPAWRDMVNRRIQTLADTRVELAFVRPDGSEALVSGLAHPCVYLGRPMRVAVFRDITFERRAEEALRNVGAYNRSLIEVSLDPLVTISPDGKITDVNQATVRATGISREALLGSDFSDYFTEPDNARAGYQEAFAKGLVTDYPLALRHASGSIMEVLYNASVYRDAKGEVTGVFAAARDITARKRAEEKLQQLAHYDLLTGLPNRSLLSDRLRQAIAAAKRDKTRLAVIFLDLDSFKPINDTFGHDVGDLLLKEVAKRLSDCVRESDTVSRVGGDEFVLLLPTVVEHDVRQVAEKMLHAVTQPFDLRGNTLHVSSSIGIALYPDHGSEEKLLIKNADTAMYRAKQSGRNNFQFFTDEMNIHASERLGLENGLRRALREREFFLVYQPLMTLESSRIVGVEALLRWRHPERGVILPEEFIPLAEESGLILPIGEWVLQTACRQLREWSQNAIPTFRIGINLSARQFRQRDLPGMVRRVMEENRVSPSNLEIELTESTLIEDAEWAAEALQQLKDMGIRLSIDDFGTGYSSLRYLQLFPIDNLKIDAHFTCDLATNANDQAIATAIIAMGHSMQMSVVAEGVETLQQLEFLRDRGCDVIQGYYVDEPLSPEKAAAALAVVGHA